MPPPPPRPPTPSRRPRKKRKLLSSNSPSSAFDLVANANTSDPYPAFPLAAFLWPARGGFSQWLLLPLILMVVGLFRWAVGLWGYSGQGVPPMHGDFEAQRHWMELTIHLPISSWYFYDLQWWGLDYPPLTAYHSWFLGKLGSLIDPSWFALESSRGIEGPLLKVFMRASVVVSEYFVYIPAVVILVRRYVRDYNVHPWSAAVGLVAILMQPTTILIDHGHFQYNTVMLGFVVGAMENLFAARALWACIFFVAALGFKQMALYYAPAIFFYMLGICFSPHFRPWRLFCMALITVLAFALLFAPLLSGALYDSYRGIPLPTIRPPFLDSLPITLEESSVLYAPVLQLAQTVHRIFPFARGIFEDKVANAWCTIHTFYKLHHFPRGVLQQVSLGATLLSILVPCAIISRYPRPQLLPLAMAATAWGFFLFSFQVHEKSVLLPLLPMTLLLSGPNGLTKESRSWIGLANTLGSFTLFPLLKRDELRVPYFVVTLLWTYLLGLPPLSLNLYRKRPDSDELGNPASGDLHIVTTLLHLGFYIAMPTWHVLEAFVSPPSSKPDLWVVLNVLIGAAGFGIMYLWCTVKLVQQAVHKKGKKADAAEAKKKQ